MQTLIRTKRKKHAASMQNTMCNHPGCIDALVSFSFSVLPFPHPCHCCHVHYFSPSFLAFLLAHEQLLAMIFGCLVVVVIPDSHFLSG